MNNSPAKVYRSRISRGICVIVTSLPFILCGSCGIYGGLDAAWFFWLMVLGSFWVCILGGIGILRTNVVIDKKGITKSHYHIEFSIAWEEIESWSAGPIPPGDDMADDSLTHQRIEFVLRSGRKVNVYDSDVWRPGFEQFVKDIEQVLKHKENCNF